MATLKSYIIESCRKYKNNTAFIVKENGSTVNISYSLLEREVTSIASGLSRFSGEKIIVTGKNSYRWALSALAVLCSGAVLVPVDGALPESEIKRISERSNASLIIYSDEISDKAEASGVNTKLPMSRLTDFFSSAEGPLPERDPDSLSILMFTSGTTSSSKAVMLSDNNILANIDSLMIAEKFYPTDINLAFLPYFHAFGLVSMFLFLGLGITSVYAKGLRIKQALSDYGVSVFVGVPLILDKIKDTACHAIEKSGKKRLFDTMVKISRAAKKIGIDLRGPLFSSVRKKIGALRMIISGAAPLSESTVEFFNDIGILIIQGYGMTETSPVISAETETRRKVGSVGIPMPNVEVIIDSPNSEGIGEILVKGPNVMLGYMDSEEQPFKDGYLKTGDLGFIDSDGFIFIRGRSKNVLVLKNGKNVYPEELESLTSSVSGVTEAVAFLSPDSRSVHLKAVYDPEITTEEEAKKGLEKINENLTEYKKLRKIIMTTEPFPKTSTGKIKRREISE